MLWIVGGFIGLYLLLMTLIFIPPIQNAIVGKVMDVLTEKWGSEISVKKIYLSLTFNLVIEDFVIKDHIGNDMIKVDKVKTRLTGVRFSPIFLGFGNLKFTEADVVLRKYEGEEAVNIAIWARKISNPDRKVIFKLKASRLDMQKSRFVFINEAEKKYDGTNTDMDYAFFELKDLFFNVTDFTIDGADISGNITKLAFNQYTGFSLNEAKACFRINENGLRFNNARLVTPNSFICMDLAFNYPHWSGFGFFTDSVSLDVNLRPSLINMNDIAAFVPALKGMDAKFILKSKINGPINNITLEKLLVYYQENTIIKGDVHLTNITDIKNVFIDLALKGSQVDFQELATIRLPDGKSLALPDMIHRIGGATLDGYFKGKLTHFDTDLKINSKAGKVSLDLAVTEQKNKLHYEGDLIVQDADLARILQNHELLGMTSLSLHLDGNSDSPKYDGDLLKSAKAVVHGNINRFDFLKYPVRNIELKADVDQKVYHLELACPDTILNFNLNGSIDLKHNVPIYKSAMVLNRFVPWPIVSKLPEVDSTTAKGFDNLLFYAQQHPSMEISFDQLELNINGTELENINGYVGIDGIAYSSNGQRFSGERLRLTAINIPSELHKFILISSMLNASLTTNYDLANIMGSLKDVAVHYLPNFFPEQKHIAEKNPSDSVKEYFIRADLETFQTRDLLSFIVPGIQISPRSTANVYISSSHNDSIIVQTRHLRFRDKVRVLNFDLQAKGEDAADLSVALKCDSIMVIQKKNNIIFSNISIKTDLTEDIIKFDLNWVNPQAFSRTSSFLAGYIDHSKRDDILCRLTNSSLNLQGTEWSFNKDHEIHYKMDHLVFDNVTLLAMHSRLSVNGILSLQKKGNNNGKPVIDDNLSINLFNLNLTQFNSITDNFNISLGGDISARVRLGLWNNRRMISGKILVSDFVLNEEHLGNLFLTAAIPGEDRIGFGGGLFSRYNLNSEIVDSYTLRNFNDESVRLATINGSFDFPTNTFVVNANVDTLKIGFLSPFLSSFSHVITGNAGGELTFIASPDSTFFKGKVTVREGIIGIAPLNTLYSLNNQDIVFDKKGFIFSNIELSDAVGNKASLDGHVYHQKFKDFQIDLNIATNRIMAINMPKQPDAFFYGTGFVSGNVSIKGDTEKLAFKGNNLKTLSGTKLYLPLTFAEKESETEGVRFKIDTTKIVKRPSLVQSSSSALDFDFIFDLNRDAEVQIDLDPAIGGVLNAKVNGLLKVAYNPETNLNLSGNLAIISGKFSMAFMNLINANFDLVQDGTISFNGPIENSLLDAQALYKTTTSLKDILPDATTRRVPVNSYINLKGELMHPTIGFAFELPDGTADDNAALNSAIDASNEGNAAKQFFSLFLTSRFSLQNSTDGGTGDMGDIGSEVLSGIVSNFLSQQLKNVDLGVNFKNVGRGGDQEFSVNASIPMWNDRIIFETSLGYVGTEEASTGGVNNWLGDFSFQFLLDDAGIWRLKTFYTNNDQLTDEFMNQGSWSGAFGVSIAYKQDFNNIKELREIYRRKGKSEKKSNKNKE